jgi:hypothetical protein
MVLELAAASPERGATFRHELKLRRSVAHRLVEHADSRAARERCQPFLDRLFSSGLTDVVTFDFDDWLAPGARPAAGLSRPELFVRRGATRVWHPHGYASHPQGIVLGARAYGVAVAELSAAFDRWAARARKGGPGAAPRSVVEVVLERPLLLAGLSLTREEWTIWWLLTQRARTLARRASAPPAFVLARRPAADDSVEAHAQFATLHRYAALLGLRLLEVASWADGWRRVADALGFRRR